MASAAAQWGVPVPELTGEGFSRHVGRGQASGLHLAEALHAHVQPSLRERASDLTLLAQSLLSRVAAGRALHLSSEASLLLAEMPFAGNIRELRNLLERASLLADGDEIEPRHILDLDVEAEASPATQTANSSGTWLTLKENEHRYLRWALAAHQGDRPTLARRLGVSERTLFRKLGNL